jgi:hypothetical protein
MHEPRKVPVVLSPEGVARFSARAPLLRRSHDHHRDLRARLLAAHTSSHRLNLDRHLMTTIATSPCRNPRLARRASTGHHGTRPDTQFEPQFDRTSLAGAAALNRSNPLMRLNTLNESVRSSYINSDTSSAVLKSP